MENVPVSRKSVFYTSINCVIYTILRIAKYEKLCYFIVTRGDTNVQVNPKAKFLQHREKSKRLESSDTEKTTGNNLKVKTDQIEEDKMQTIQITAKDEIKNVRCQSE